MIEKLRIQTKNGETSPWQANQEDTTTPWVQNQQWEGVSSNSIQWELSPKGAF